MFVGEYHGTIDAERRFEIPAVLMDPPSSPAGQKGMVAVAGRPPDGAHMRLYPVTTFEPWYRRFRAKTWVNPDEPSIGFAEFDTAGRLWLPEQPVLRANLCGAVLVLGLIEWIEVWNPEGYAAALADAELNFAEGRHGWRPWLRPESST